MAGNLFNIGRYFKKDQEQNGKAQDGKVIEKKEESVTIKTTSQNHNGIHPSQTYSVTNQAPSNAEPYSGIGNPPSGNVKQEVKTTTTTQKTVPDKSTPPPSSTIVSSTAIDMNKRSSMDILTRLTQRSTQCLMVAANKAKELGCQYIDSEHVLWGLLTDAQIYQLISELKVVPKQIQDDLEKNFKKGNFAGRPQFSPRVKKILELAFSTARSLGFEFVSPEHILVALVAEGEGLAAKTLVKFNLTIEVLNKKVTGKKEGAGEEEKRSISVVEQFCEDLTQKAREGKLDPVVGRSAEIERTIHILSRRTKNNPVLIGDAGVGKTAIVEGLAQKIAKGDVPETLLNKKILQLDLMSLIAGARHRGEFEERLKNLIKEVKSSSGLIILFIDEIHNMVGAGSGSEGTMDASNILKPSLARGELQAIGTTTITEYRKHIEKDPALERRFQPIQVLEPSEDKAIEMLHAIRDKYEAFHKVSIPDDVIESAVRLSKRYVGDRFLPDKAVDLIDEASAAVRLPAISLPEEIKSTQLKITRLENEKKEAQKINDQIRLASLDRELQENKDELFEKTQEYEKKKSTTTNVVTTDAIQDIVSRWTNIPVSKLTEKETDKLIKLEDLIHKRIIDQSQAVTAVSEAVRRGRAGLKSSKRPIGSFVFMGPTGVGKTELAKALAEILFGSEEMIVRLDMTEYMERHEVAKLIGAPPGYVGYDEGGQLTEAVRRHPYSVVLFDEIEKAHPDVFNILIQLLDDGRLTDNKGHTISFKNTIVICTSNIGTNLIQQEIIKDQQVGDELPKQNEDKDKDKDGVDTGINPAAIALNYGLDEDSVNKIVREFIKYWLKQNPQELSSYSKNEEIINKLVEKTQLPKEQITQVFEETNKQSPNQENLAEQSETASNEQDKVIDALCDHLSVDKTQIFDKIKKTKLSENDINNIADKLKLEKNTVKEIFENITKEEEEKSADSEIKPPSQTNIMSLSQKSKIDQKVVENIISILYETAVILKPNSISSIVDLKEVIDNVSQKTQVSKDLVISLIKTISLLEGDCDIAKIGSELKIEQASIHQVLRQIPLELIEKNPKILADELESVNNTMVYEEVAKHANVKAEEVKLIIQEIINLSKEDATKAEVKEDVEDDIDQEQFAQMAEMLLAELRKFFRPELLNRFDEVVVFRPLGRQHMIKIVDLQISQLAKLLEDQGLGFQVSLDAKEKLAVLGFDPIYGARPLRRTIQRYIENPISSLLIKGEAKSGDSIIVNLVADEFKFEVKKMQPRENQDLEVKQSDEDNVASTEPKEDINPLAKEENVNEQKDTTLAGQSMAEDKVNKAQTQDQTSQEAPIKEIDNEVSGVQKLDENGEVLKEEVENKDIDKFPELTPQANLAPAQEPKQENIPSQPQEINQDGHVNGVDGKATSPLSSYFTEEQNQTNQASQANTTPQSPIPNSTTTPPASNS